MKIADPVLAPDVSSWCNRINSKEMEDGGCQSIVIGLYPVTVNGVLVLNPTCRAQLEDASKNSNLVIQAYMWDDITLDPTMQAHWAVDTVIKEGYPIKYIWADDEQWWTSWTARNQALAGKIPWSAVPRGTPAGISSHMMTFMFALHSRFPASGVYTNNGFVASWAPAMNGWLTQYASWVPQYGREPAVATQMTWAQMKANWMPNYDLILASGQYPGLVNGHQFEGDMIKLPGAYDGFGNQQVVDLNVFSAAFINQLRGTTPPAPAPVPVPTPAGNYVVTVLSWIFATPNDGAGCKLIGKTSVGMPVMVTQVQGDWAQLSQPTAGWVRLADLRKV